MAIFFEAFVPVPLSVADAPSEKAPVHKGRKDSEKKSRLWLTICWGGGHGKVSASEVSAAVTSVGEETVRRHLAKMVEGGQLAKGNGGRATVYRKGR